MSVLHRCLLSVSFVLLLFFLFYNTSWLGSWVYPIEYKEEIKNNAVKFELDPFLLAAIIRVESNYDPARVSPKGAIGLMQVMPDTADWIAVQGGYSPLDRGRLRDTEVNIKYGAWYVNWIESRYPALDEGSLHDQIALIATAYNAGPGKLSEWLANDIWDGRYKNAALIPFGETRHYIKRIIYFYLKYEKNYDVNWFGLGNLD